MDDASPFRKKWLYIVAWLAILLIVYGWQILRMGGIQASIVDIFVDLACIFPAFLLLWMAFFAQFVLPVRTFRDRQRIFDRLITYLLGGHGPAIFIRNGELIKREGEERKKGPGVLWLDSASAAVTRTAVAIKQTLGPVVHFIANKEYIAGTVDLHIQSHSVGPKESDNPFEARSEEQNEEEYNQIQDRRKQVSTLTRDGIEVIPNISVTFRVDTGFPKEGQPGSRFGYRTGTIKKDKENEERDKEAIRRAILGEGINPNAQSDSPRRRVAWNQLPASLAVDVWREYAAKFTLDQLFEPSQPVSTPSPPQPQPTEEEIDILSQPIQVGSSRDAIQDGLTRMVRQVNLLMAGILKRLESRREEQAQKPLTPAPSPQPAAVAGTQMKTALQVINDMVKARLTEPEVDILDATGTRGQGKIPSPEFRLLQERGLRVLGVSVSNPRFNSEVEKETIDQWEAAWLASARAEKDQIDRRRSLIETSGQEQAVRQYADLLSQSLAKDKPSGIKATLKTLLMRSRSIIIRNDLLRSHMSSEQQELEGIIRWIEVNGP